MIEINIPGNASIQAKHLVLDYNGTLAIDGIMIPGVEEKLNILAEKINLHVLTADTYGNAGKSLANVQCVCVILNENEQQIQKQEYIKMLGIGDVIAIGNGLNDALMLKSAALGIIVVQREGASAKTLIDADIICTNILDALELLSNPLRITATLRS